MAGSLVGRMPRAGGAFFNGAGFISGAAPGIVTAASVPARRLVLAMERVSRLVVQQTWSASNGTYRLDNLSPDLRFDVIGRDYTDTYEDVIVSRIAPVRYAMSSTGTLTAVDATNTLTGSITVAGGVPPLALSVASGTAPPGLTFTLTAATVADVPRVIGANGTAANGAYSWTLRVTDADGRRLDIGCSATYT